MGSHTGPSEELASRIIWRMWARQAPNYVALGVNAFFVEAFTNGVVSSGSLLELYINRGLRLFCSTEASMEMRMAVPKSSMASTSVRKMLNPHWVRSIISPWNKSVDSEDMVKDQGPLVMAWWMVVRDHPGMNPFRESIDRLVLKQ